MTMIRNMIIEDRRDGYIVASYLQVLERLNLCEVQVSRQVFGTYSITVIT